MKKKDEYKEQEEQRLDGHVVQFRGFQIALMVSARYRMSRRGVVLIIKSILREQILQYQLRSQKAQHQ